MTTSVGSAVVSLSTKQMRIMLGEGVMRCGRDHAYSMLEKDLEIESQALFLPRENLMFWEKSSK